MMRRFHGLVFALLSLLACFGGTRAQSQTQSDTLAVDTVRNKWLPTGVRAGLDVISLVKTRTQDNFEGWEVQGDIDFSRYYLALEYGSSGRTLASDLSSYANTGTYWRAGVDVNFLMKDPERNVLFLGGRYGRSRFTESLTVSRVDPIWGSMSDSFYHSDVNAWWIELTAGLRVRVLKLFWLGYTGRFKFALSNDGTEEMIPHDVPGFGRTDKETTWGFNYYLMVRIPFRKAPPLRPEE